MKFQPAALLRRFSVLFVGFSLLPLALVFYLYLQMDDSGKVLAITRDQLAIITALTAVLCISGFLSMHFLLAKVARLTDNLKKSLIGDLDKEVIAHLVKEEGEIGELARSFSQIFTKLENNIAELEATRATLHEVFAKVSKALSSIEDLDSMVRLILETATDALSTDQGVLFSLNADGTFGLKACVGRNGHSEDDIMKSADSLLSWVQNERKLLVLPELENPNVRSVFQPPLVCAPLICHDKLWGAVCLNGRSKGSVFTENELEIISNLCYQLALSIRHLDLSHDMERSYFDTMSALAMAVEARDPYSRGHSERVGQYAELIGQELELSPDELQTLRDASRLHDVGKIGITDSILRKPGPLTEQEREIMKKHPAIGETIVKPLRTFTHLISPIRHHHEYLDGSGYPDGLRGEQIPLITRIMTVADIYDALTEDRPYRSAMTPEMTKSVFTDLVREGKVDRIVVAALFRIIDNHHAPIHPHPLKEPTPAPHPSQQPQ